MDYILIFIIIIVYCICSCVSSTYSKYKHHKKISNARMMFIIDTLDKHKLESREELIKEYKEYEKEYKKYNKKYKEL